MLPTFRRPFLRAATVAVAASLAIAGLGTTPASGAVTTDTFFTMIGGGDYIGGSANQLFHSGNATLTVSGNASYVRVVASGGTHSKSFDVEMAAPQGATLTPGVYENAGRIPFQTAAQPGLDVSGDGRGCNTVVGRFVVHDMATGENGVINRFSATYEHHCEGGLAALRGQVSINQPAVSDVLVAGTRYDWGDAYRDHDAKAMPVWVVNRGTAAVTTSGAMVSGPNAAEFPIASNGCGTLAAGASCLVSLKFRPAEAGARTATFSVADSGGGTHDVALTGSGIPGFTEVHLHSAAGDPVGAGGAYRLIPPTSPVETSGGQREVTMRGSEWWMTFGAPAEETLTAGTTYSTATGAVLWASRTGGNCPSYWPEASSGGTFTVHEVSFRDGTGQLETFSATFEQKCRSSTAALRGWVSWRATAANRPPAPADQPVSGLKAFPELDSIYLTWTNPTLDFSHVVVRGAYGGTPPASPTAGFAVYTGQGSSTGISYLTPGASYAFTVFAVDVVGTVSSPRSVVVRGTGIFLSASAATVTYGQYTTISAKLVEAATRRPVTNRVVELYVRKKGDVAFSWYRDVTTDAYGVAKVTLNPAATYEWQAQFHGAWPHVGSTTGPLTVSVQHKVSATMSATSVRRYAYVTVKGAVAPARPGQYVYLQRYYSGAWRNAGTIRLTSASAYSYTFRPTVAGTWQYRVYKPGDSALAAGASPVRTLTVT